MSYITYYPQNFHHIIIIIYYYYYSPVAPNFVRNVLGKLLYNIFLLNFNVKIKATSLDCKKNLGGLLCFHINLKALISWVGRLLLGTSFRLPFEA